MLTKLMREHGGIKPVEAGIAPIDQFHQCIQHLCLAPDFVSEAEVLIALSLLAVVLTWLIRGPGGDKQK